MQKTELRQMASRELARRELARRDFSAFCPLIYRGYPSDPHAIAAGGTARHLRVLCEYLQQVEIYVASGGSVGIGRLMVFMPPRYWKSTTTSVLFPVWALGNHPDWRVIISSYNGDLAKGFSRRARNHIVDIPYRNIFGDRAGIPTEVAVSDDSRAAESWDIEGARGGLVAVGVGGGATGKGAQIFIIDDPIKDRKEAESKSMRDDLEDWYKAVAYTRLERDGAIVLMMTRWHADDLAGRLLKRWVTEPGADSWTVLSMSAVAQEYDAQSSAN